MGSALKPTAKRRVFLDLGSGDFPPILFYNLFKRSLSDSGRLEYVAVDSSRGFSTSSLKKQIKYLVALYSNGGAESFRKPVFSRPRSRRSAKKRFGDRLKALNNLSRLIDEGRVQAIRSNWTNGFPVPSGSVDVAHLQAPRVSKRNESKPILKNADAFLREVKRVLRPGGVFVLSLTREPVWRLPGAPPQKYRYAPEEIQFPLFKSWGELKASAAKHDLVLEFLPADALRRRQDGSGRLTDWASVVGLAARIRKPR